MRVLIVLASVVGLTLAQFPGGRILEPPIPALCAQRVIHERSPDSKGYWFSWRDPNTQGSWWEKSPQTSLLDFLFLRPGKEEDWLGARNFCRQRCMDLVSVETSPENEWIKQRIVEGKVSSLTAVNGSYYSLDMNINVYWNSLELCICVA